jgi:signal transduction histidine kinase
MTENLLTGIRTIQKTNEDLEMKVRERTQSLNDLNQNLEIRVEEEINKRRSQEQLLIHQSRLAAMGEMLGAVAHQWRQPLNTIGILLQNIEEDAREGSVDYNEIKNTVDQSMELIIHMSDTIDDFRTFFHPDRKKEQVNLKTILSDIRKLFAPQVCSNGTELCIVIDDEHNGNDYITNITPCDFKQIIINLVNNAREAICHKVNPEGNGKITISLDSDIDYYIVKVSDNGTGIHPDILDRIYEPYFTTKKTGSGIGLYMAKTIIGNNMHGTISCKSGTEGTDFIIRIPVRQPQHPEPEFLIL